MLEVKICHKAPCKKIHLKFYEEVHVMRKENILVMFHRLNKFTFIKYKLVRFVESQIMLS